MIKTLRDSLRRDREKLKIPRSVQQSVPISRVWPDGILQVGNRFSKCFAFSDINYAIASDEDKESAFYKYSECFDTRWIVKMLRSRFTIGSRIKKGWKKSIPSIPGGWPGYIQKRRKRPPKGSSHGQGGIVQERYITISAYKRTVEDARTYFARMETELAVHFGRLSSRLEAQNLEIRLETLRDFFHAGEPASLPFSLKGHMRLGHDFRDWFCPDSMEFQRDCFRMDNRWGRVLYLREYASFVRDDLVSELCGLSRSLMLSLDLLPVPTEEAVKEIERKLLSVETDIANWQRRQNAARNFSAEIPYELEQRLDEIRELLNDVTKRDQRILFGLLTLVHTAETKEQLDSDTEALLSIARKKTCYMSVLRWQQKDGLDTALPYGLRKIHALRTMTTENAAALTPFRAQDISHPNGLFYGQNAITKNRILIDRRSLQNGNCFRLGVSGSGKSLSAKDEIVQILLGTQDDILILDPESEYAALVNNTIGEVVHISAVSDTHLNAMDMDPSYGNKKDSLIEKADFILSLFEQLVGFGNLSPKEKSILDRCTSQVYEPYIRGGYNPDETPTLKDLYALLLQQPEEEAHGLALSAELFITGSLNTFAHKTNVNTSARVICYDIRELGEQLMPIGMLVTLDAIYNRVIRNWKHGKTTWIFCDEFYLLFRYPYSADFFYKLWKRIRKYNGLLTGLTQNVEELLLSDTARMMLANSEFLVLLNQAATDREELARLLNISRDQLSYIENVPPGHGLIRCGGSILPFRTPFQRIQNCTGC